MDSAATRVWLTGVGLVTPLGTGVETSWRRLFAGERAIGEVRLFDTAGQRTSLAAEVRELELPPGARAISGAWSRTSVMAVTAAREALAEARLDVRATRVGLVVGGTTAGMFETEALLARYHAEPEARDVLLDMLSHPLTSTSDRLVENLGPFTRVRTLCSACSSGANAFIVAAQWLLSGEVDAVLAGGADGLCRLTFTGFNALGAIDKEPCRPFDRRRRGLSLGEGAGFAVLERGSQATRRGAKPVAELAGWALGSEAHHITNPEPEGQVVARLIACAMARAGIDAGAVDYVNAHGTGTPLNDPMEAAALARALGPEVRRALVSSSKGQIGHTLGAAGAIEGILAALAVARQAVVPTAGLDDPDEACALQHVPHQGRRARVRAALSNSFAFGGMDTVLVLTEPGLGAARDPVRRAVVVTGAALISPSGVMDARAAAGFLGGDDAAEPGAGVAEVADLDSELEAARARRLHRGARLAAIVAQRALAQSGGSREDDVGVVLGSAFGSVDASAAFMHRLGERGARLASPAEFPNLVPSSPVGHVAIYLALHGPVFATADLATSGESAFVQGAALVASGEATRMIAGAVEEKSDIVERVLWTLFGRPRRDGHTRRAEGASALVLEDEGSARTRKAAILARVRQVLEWRESGPEGALAVRPLPPRDARRAEVVLARPDEAASQILAATAWAACPRRICRRELGQSEGLGAAALVAAVGRIDAGEVDEALVVGVENDRGYAILLERRA